MLAALAAEGRLLLPPLPHGCCVGCQKEGGGAKEEGPGRTAGSDAGTLLAAGGAVGAPLAPDREQTQGTLEVEPGHVHCLVLFVQEEEEEEEEEEAAEVFLAFLSSSNAVCQWTLLLRALRSWQLPVPQLRAARNLIMASLLMVTAQPCVLTTTTCATTRFSWEVNSGMSPYSAPCLVHLRVYGGTWAAVW